MPDLFKEIVPSILKTKKSVFDGDYKDYKPWIVNRALSYHMDCIPYVQDMNTYSLLDSDMQYSYYLNSIRPMKRDFKPWQKSQADQDVDSVKKYFGYSNEKARDALRVLTEEQIAEIRKRTEKGGVKK